MSVLSLEFISVNVLAASFLHTQPISQARFPASMDWPQKLLFTAFLVLALAVDGTRADAMLSGNVFCDLCKDGQISLFDYPVYGVRVEVVCTDVNGQVTMRREEVTNLVGNYVMRFDGSPHLSSCRARVSGSVQGSSADCGLPGGPAQSIRLVFRIFDLEMYTVGSLLAQPSQPGAFCPRNVIPVPGQPNPYLGPPYPTPGQPNPYPGPPYSTPGPPNPYLGPPNPTPRQADPYPGPPYPIPRQANPYPAPPSQYSNPGPVNPILAPPYPVPGQDNPYPGPPSPVPEQTGPYSPGPINAVPVPPSPEPEQTDPYSSGPVNLVPVPPSPTPEQTNPAPRLPYRDPEPVAPDPGYANPVPGQITPAPPFRLPPLPPMPPLPLLQASVCSYQNWTTPEYRCYWRALDPDMKVSVIFGSLAGARYGTDMTLQQGLEGRGDPYQTLLREGITALLNSYLNSLFQYPPIGVVQHLNWALMGTSRQVLITALDFIRANSGSGIVSCKFKPCN